MRCLVTADRLVNSPESLCLFTITEMSMVKSEREKISIEVGRNLLSS